LIGSIGIGSGDVIIDKDVGSGVRVTGEKTCGMGGPLIRSGGVDLSRITPFVSMI
jgi:hypothetical protein